MTDGRALRQLRIAATLLAALVKAKEDDGMFRAAFARRAQRQRRRRPSVESARELPDDTAGAGTAMIDHVYEAAVREVEQLRAQLTAALQEQERLKENETLLLRQLSDALTGGNAGTWDEILHAARRAEDAAAQITALQAKADRYEKALSVIGMEFCANRDLKNEACDCPSCYASQQLLTAHARGETRPPVDTYTPILWATLSDDERYAEYVRVRNLVARGETPMATLKYTVNESRDCAVCGEPLKIGELCYRDAWPDAFRHLAHGPIPRALLQSYPAARQETPE